MNNIFDEPLFLSKYDNVGKNTLAMEDNAEELKRYLELL